MGEFAGEFAWVKVVVLGIGILAALILWAWWPRPASGNLKSVPVPAVHRAIVPPKPDPPPAPKQNRFKKFWAGMPWRKGAAAEL